MGFQSKLTSKGQTTIPAEVRESMALNSGDTLLYIPCDDGSYRIYAKNLTVDDLAGILGPPPKGAGATQEDIDKTIAKAVADEDRRIAREWREGVE